VHVASIVEKSCMQDFGITTWRDFFGRLERRLEGDSLGRPDVNL
jgi:hypothetical protein